MAHGCSPSPYKAPGRSQIGAFLSHSCNFSPVIYSRDRFPYRSNQLCKKNPTSSPLANQKKKGRPVGVAKKRSPLPSIQPAPGETRRRNAAESTRGALWAQRSPAGPASGCSRPPRHAATATREPALTSPPRFNVTVTLHSTLHPISFEADKDCFCFISIGLLMAYSLLSRCIFIR